MPNQLYHKILLIVRLTTVILIASLMQLSAATFGQRISLDKRNVPLKSVLRDLTRQSGFGFFYDGKVIEDNQKVNVKLVDVEFDVALDSVLNGLKLSYSIDGKIVSIKKLEESSLFDKPGSKFRAIDVRGKIFDEAKKPVEGASVFVKGTSIGTLTDISGYFLLNGVPDHSVLRISCIGYIPVDIGIRKSKGGYTAYAIQKEQAQNLSLDGEEEVNFRLRLTSAIGELKGVSVNTDANASKQIGTVVDLKHRNHLNLGQVLEGSVPGLTLKSTLTTNKELTLNSIIYSYLVQLPDELYTGVERIKELYKKLLSGNPAVIKRWPTFDSFYNQAYALASNTPAEGYFSTMTTTNNSGLIPELRGSSSFTGNTSGMLVVIDGIEQTGFPSSYPMSNVVKVEVVKDPAELIKWGPKATGGLIMITTNGAKSGKLQFNYNSNFSYSGKPNISNTKLQLASSGDVLSYYKEQVEKGLANYIPAGGNFNVPPVGLTPAQWLLYNLKKNNLPYTDAKFVASWDSLANLSNREQLHSLYQNVFTQTHSLTMAGGSPIWNFSLGGNYNQSPGSAIGSNSTSLQLNLQNRFSLLKNKLKITWQLNTNNSDSQNSTGNDGSSLDPYQMLQTPGNEYVYDYTIVSPVVNSEMLQLGYENNGVNALEDARNTKNSNKTSAINSLLNVNWDLSKSLQWSTLFAYNENKTNTQTLQGAASSQVRQLRNNYGSPDGNDGVKMYIPEGDILYSSLSKGLTWNLRSGLNFNHSFDDRNVLTAALGLGATHMQSKGIPYANIYGYGPDTPGGLSLLAFPENGIVNYLGAVQYPSSLQSLGFNTSSVNRSFSLNGNMGYVYDNRYSVNVQYGSIYTPNAGFYPSYSGTKNYEAKASWMVSNEQYFHIPFISKLTLSALASKIQLGKSPDFIPSGLIAQPIWNNSALLASGYTPSELNGQQVSNIGGMLQLGLLQERIYVQAGYNHSSDGSDQLNGQVVYQIHREPWFKVPFISQLVVDASLQNFNSFQAQAIVMGTNLPNANGGFSLASNTNFTLLPPATINKEAHIMLGLFNDRLIFDTRYYHKIISGTSGSDLLPPDPSTGVSSQLSYSRMLNKGVEFYLKGKVIQRSDFSYSVTINGAYNINQALDIPNIPFTQLQSYLSALRTGYATDALWSYRWAGLDNLGNPQVYRDMNTIVPVLSGTDANGQQLTPLLDANSLIYSGRTRAPWSGGLIQDWTYHSFFASARLMLNLGHIMRTYVPVVGPRLDKNIRITQRWQNPGDEAVTDVAAMAQFNSTRALVIQNSSNSIVSASNIRLREVQFGYEVPDNILKNGFIQALTISVQIQNLALWTRNKLGLDPSFIGSNGMPSIREPRQYRLTLNANF